MEDRVKLYNWNLACCVVTAIPFVYMMRANYHTSYDTTVVHRTLDPLHKTSIMYLQSIHVVTCRD